MERRFMKLHADGILAYVDIPENPKGIIHFVHGMMEEIGDYEFLVDQVMKKSYIFVRQEITGHGDLAVDGKRGYMGKSPEGWNNAVLAIHETYCCVRRTFGMPYPYFMVGFSLGSFIIRQAFLAPSAMTDVAGVCLIGTGNKSLAELKFAEFAARIKCRKYGEDNSLGVVDTLMMDNYNRKIKNETGQYRWLFSNETCAEKFDPHGYAATPQLFYDFVLCMERVRKQVGSLSKLPLLLLSGAADPVTGDITLLEKQFRKMGCNVESCAIPGKRHHILRDADAENSLIPFWDWIESKAKAAEYLSDADLRRADLSDADLSGVDLRCADLSGADLRHANLRRADLNVADLSGADLSGADLSGADLRRANLRRADLSDTDLSGADLRRATLSGANLSGANLSQTKGILDAINYLEAHFEKTENGYIVYKTFGEHYTAPDSWKIEPGSIIEETVNPDRGTECGCGINVSPLDWVRKNSDKTPYKLLIRWEWLPGVVVPFSTNGRIRCSKAEIVGEVE